MYRKAPQILLDKKRLTQRAACETIEAETAKQTNLGRKCVFWIAVCGILHHQKSAM